MGTWLKTGGLIALAAAIGIGGTLGVQKMTAPAQQQKQQQEEPPDMSRYVSVDIRDQLSTENEELRGKLTVAEKERDNAKSELAKADVGKVRAELTSVKEALAKAPKKADLDAATLEAMKAKEQVADLEGKLTAAETERDNAKEALVKADVGKLQKELQSTKQALAKAPKQTDLDSVRMEAKTAQGKLGELEKKLAAAPKAEDLKALQAKVKEAESSKVIAAAALKAVPTTKHTMKDVVLLATDGKDIVAATKDGTVTLLGEKATKAFTGLKATPTSLAVGDGRVAAAVGKAYVVWNVEDGKVAASGNHTEEITSVGFTKSGLAINDATPKTALPSLPQALKDEWGVADGKVAYASSTGRLAVMTADGVTVRSLPAWLK